MFDDYSARVVEHYRKKVQCNELSPNLTRPTPAKLRDECLLVINARYSTNDERTLRIFFGQKTSQAEYENAIRNFDTDKFKPLRNFLRGETHGTDEKNIELLAWLSDYQPRPYGRASVLANPIPEESPLTSDASHEKIQDSTTVQKPAGTSEIDSNNFPESSAKRSSFKKHQKTATILLILITILGGSYAAFTNFLTPQECMYWTGARYQPISCNEKVVDTRVLALDPEKVKDFKKILLTDTITLNALGYVWYSKINNRLEFFTAAGTHPVHDERHLKPISEYIINKYLKRVKKVDEKMPQ